MLALYNLTILVACSFAPLGLLAAAAGPLSPLSLPFFPGGRVLTTLDSPNVLASGYVLPFTNNTLSPPSYLEADTFLFPFYFFFYSNIFCLLLSKNLRIFTLKFFFFFLRHSVTVWPWLAWNLLAWNVTRLKGVLITHFSIWLETQEPSQILGRKI